MSMCENIPNASNFLLTGQPIECSLHSRLMLQAISSPMGAVNCFMVEQNCDLLPTSFSRVQAPNTRLPYLLQNIELLEYWTLYP